ncbi:MAG: hypothetical protein QMD85_03365 [Candidatus Aenigmarchaeota archaeon]|nr:hypothetical protein [Candidatus Aenigmarchaeota archaeon]MDI6722582.1 hypothetical protein [Candidatus Aenigmarchaeota archaeon]
MLSDEEKNMKIICTKCKERMKEAVLDRYEYVEGFPLFDVPAFQCKKCGNVFFTESMADKMEERTKELQRKAFGFRRSLSVSGNGLVVRIPTDLAEYLDMKEGTDVRIIPVDHKGFIVEKEEKR